MNKIALHSRQHATSDLNTVPTGQYSHGRKSDLVDCILEPDFGRDGARNTYQEDAGKNKLLDSIDFVE